MDYDNTDRLEPKKSRWTVEVLEYDTSSSEESDMDGFVLDGQRGVYITSSQFVSRQLTRRVYCSHSVTLRTLPQDASLRERVENNIQTSLA
jgi:hypothetical protein